MFTWWTLAPLASSGDAMPSTLHDRGMNGSLRVCLNSRTGNKEISTRPKSSSHQCCITPMRSATSLLHVRITTQTNQAIARSTQRSILKTQVKDYQSLSRMASATSFYDFKPLDSTYTPQHLSMDICIANHRFLLRKRSNVSPRKP